MVYRYRYTRQRTMVLNTLCMPSSDIDVHFPAGCMIIGRIFVCIFIWIFTFVYKFGRNTVNDIIQCGKWTIISEFRYVLRLITIYTTTAKRAHINVNLFTPRLWPSKTNYSQGTVLQSQRRHAHYEKHRSATISAKLKYTAWMDAFCDSKKMRTGWEPVRPIPNRIGICMCLTHV